VGRGKADISRAVSDLWHLTVAHVTLSATSSPAWTPATSSAFLVGTAQTLTFALQPGGGAPGAIWLQEDPPADFACACCPPSG
jgi:hypothetical protein